MSNTPAESSYPPVPHMPAKQTSLPIARSSGAAYDRPERARTSHACEPCRERKTKCDGERPSCRRCSHTSTACHYGYGKGWRKRKTAEDLTATSRRLQRYEALLNDILPHVTPSVKAMIDDARAEHDATMSNSGGSETADTPDLGRGPPGFDRNNTSSSRGSLPLPMPGSMQGQGGLGPLPPPLTRSFDNISPPNATNSVPRPPSATSPDAAGRLPSIMPDGKLIEPNLFAQRANMLSISSEPSMVRDQSNGTSNSSPLPSAYPGWSPQSEWNPNCADRTKRDFETAFGAGVASSPTEALQS